MSSHPTDGIAELIGQIVEDLFNLLVRKPDALNWSAAERQHLRDWFTDKAETYFAKFEELDADIPL